MILMISINVPVFFRDLQRLYLMMESMKVLYIICLLLPLSHRMLTDSNSSCPLIGMAMQPGLFWMLSGASMENQFPVATISSIKLVSFTSM